MPANFLDLHIVDFCNLNCKHCYLNKGKRVMPLDMLRAICEDFLSTDFPLPESTVILSGGEPLLHPDFVEASNIVRKLNGHITMSTNGILIPKYIDVFEKNDGIHVNIDGDRETHDRIRGKGSYDKAIKALKCLKEHRINHSIGFALCKRNFHCVDHILELCKKYECTMLNFMPYQSFNKKFTTTVRFSEWLKAKEYVSRHVKTFVTCLETGGVAGICGIAVTPDLNYWDCPRHQEIMGRYPQPIKEVLRRSEDIMNPFDTCCKYLGW